MKGNACSLAAAGSGTCVATLCRREAWRAASWWADLSIMALFGGLTWVLVTKHFLTTRLTDSLGSITSAAMGMCVGAAIPLLLRVLGAMRLGCRLNLRHGAGQREAVRSYFLAASLNQAGISSTRCSDEDLRRMVAIAASNAVSAARLVAVPATLAAFLAPAISLIGGLDMAQRSTLVSPMAAIAPSMIAGLLGGLLVWLLVELLTAVIHNAVARWGAGLELAEVEKLAGRPGSSGVRSVAPSDGGATEIMSGSTSTGPAEVFDQVIKNFTNSG